MFNKHEEIYVASEETLKKKIHVGALNYPVKRTVDPISLSLTQTEFRKLSLGLCLLHLKLGEVCWPQQTAGLPRKLL